MFLLTSGRDYGVQNKHTGEGNDADVSDVNSFDGACAN